MTDDAKTAAVDPDEPDASLSEDGGTAAAGEVEDLGYAVLGAPKIAKPSFPVLDLLGEALAGVLARPARLFLTALGTVLGIAALVATLGLARTAGAQIVGTFDELSATRITIEPADANFGAADVSSIPWDAGDRIERLNGVTAAGIKSSVDTGGALVRSVPIVDPLGANEFAIDVVAGSPGLADAVRASMWQGRWFDDGHELRTSNVAVLGPAAAARLNINRVDHQPAIFVGAETDEQAFVVIGILEDVERETDLLSAIIIPSSTAQAVYGLEAPAEVHIDVEVGAAELIGGTIDEDGNSITGQALIALDPNDPSRLSAQTPPSLRSAQTAVEDDINGLFLILGGISLLVGALGIANVTLVSVLERTSEIGLRRALGAARRHIAAQFLVESTVTGLLGGLIGASIGTLTIVAASASRDWTPVLDQWLPFAATAAGAGIGLLSGTYPALRAARTEPISALRTE